MRGFPKLPCSRAGIPPGKGASAFAEVPTQGRTATTGEANRPKAACAFGP